MASSDEYFIQQALKQAKKGLGLTNPNPPVGAVIVAANGTLLGSGFHRQAGGPHAEVEAIRKALKKHPARALRNSTLYITLEPCSTSGKTPACTDAIVEHGFSRVVYGCNDPNPEHQGRAKRRLARHRISVTSGVLEKECQSLIRFFAKHTTTGLPWVMAKSALTLDGKTCLPPGQGKWITGKEARADVQRLRSQVDAILIGGATLRQDDPRLTLRGTHARKERRQPLRVITTQSGDLPAKARVFCDRHRDRTRVFKKQSLLRVLRQLGKEGVQSVMMESGGKLLANALKNTLLDEVVFYYAPIIGGGSTRAIQIDGLTRELDSMEVKKFGRDFRVRGLVEPASGKK